MMMLKLDKELDMVMEFKFGQMEQNIKDNGLITELLAKASFGTQTVTFSKVNSKMINQSVTEFILVQMVPDMKACGLMIFNMAKAQLSGLMDQLIQETTIKEENKA